MASYNAARVDGIHNTMRRTDIERIEVDQLVFFALMKLHPAKTETEITYMVDRARKALEEL